MDAEEEERQAEIDRRMESLIGRTAGELQAAGEDRDATAAVIARFLDEGLDILDHPGMMWGYFDKALVRAGYDERGQDRRLRIYSTVSHERFAPGEPFEDDWPWLEGQSPET
jgi:hypothetical protein